MPADAAIAELAAQQQGLVTSAQLVELGETRSDIAYRVRVGRLHRVHRGVYLVGHGTLSPLGARRAVLLASGADAFLGGRTALAMHGARADDRCAFDVVVPGRGEARGPTRALVTRMRTIHPDDVVEMRGLRVASLARALADASGTLSDQELRKVIKEADYLRIIDVAAVIAAVARTPNRPGVARLRKALRTDEQLASSEEFVLRFLALASRHGLRQPTVDLHLDTGLPSLGQIDLAYEPERVIIELDGTQAHMTRHRFEEDRRRDAHLAARGWLTLRYTWRRVTQDAADVAAEVRAVLASRWHR